ncbi:MAG TPA: 30S ribosome-binding factor RbfA [Candidatus Acidoferrum sp.]|nr:30S ribosome-binding factor RbfA [Candidatus Acidoferrum sp.]
MTQRTDRLDELLRQEIGAMLEREVADPRIGFATVTKVETTPDLRHAKVWVSIIGRDAERAAGLTALEHTMVFIRRELGTRLRLKRIPDLHVRLDDSIERGTRILTLIDAIETGADPGAAPVGESLPTPKRGIGAGEREASPPDVAAEVLGVPDVAEPPRPHRPADDGFGGAAADYAASLAADLTTRRNASRNRVASGKGSVQRRVGPGRPAPGAAGKTRRPGG